MSTYIWLLLSKVYLWYLSVSCVTIHFFLYVSQCIICIYHTLPTLLLLNILFFSQFAIIMNKAATFYTCILLLNLHLWAKLLNHKIHVHAGTWASWLVFRSDYPIFSPARSAQDYQLFLTGTWYRQSFEL